jgi:acyl-CoA thioesterase-1
MRRLGAVACAALLQCACAGSPPASSTGQGQGAPGPPRAVSGIVFYDENADGLLDGTEALLLPGVTVRVADRTATTDASGRFAIPDAPTGAALTADASTLPPYFEPRPVPVPGADTTSLQLPVVLPIGTNRPHVYVAFGDSLTAGVGSRGGRGYLPALQEMLRARWGRGEVIGEAQGGTRSDEGVSRLPDALARVKPAYVLIDYGTNDYSHECRQAGECPTIPSLRAMIRDARAAGSLPVVATLLPGNPGTPDPLSQARDAWVVSTNEAIRAMAREEGAPVADVWSAFEAEGQPERLFTDYLHPNERGYDVFAREFFTAITSPRPR